MIPTLTHSGVLPPYIGPSPTRSAGMAPYQASATELVATYATTGERIALLRGFFAFRSELGRLGIIDGFQWIDGSFVEDVETTRGQAPGDIDLVTFARRPTGMDDAAWRAIWVANPELFDPISAKARFGCEAFFIDLSLRPEVLVDRSRYWFGLFSHQRATATWKGMLRIPLNSDDTAAGVALAALPP